MCNHNIQEAMESLVGSIVTFFTPRHAEPKSGTVRAADVSCLEVSMPDGTVKVIHPSWVIPTTMSMDDKNSVLHLLMAAGEDPQRPGLLETPERFIKAWRFWTSGYSQKPADVLKVFEDGAEGCDQAVLQTGIPIWSLCEHHLAPFFGEAHIAYIPDKKIVGLSKLARLANIFSKRLQVQERLTNQIAQALHDELKPKGVAVMLRCRHSCMESRGVQIHGTFTTTTKLFGAYLDEPSAREEFYSMVGSR